MNFVELDRLFIPIGKEEEPNVDIGRIWGRKLGGWLDWADLHMHQRAVLLAEASSGKSAEFRNQADKLGSKGYPAFFIPIEELADHGLEAALDPGVSDGFQQWRDGVGEGWFFLDALDEARLNRKSFESALKRVSKELGISLERAKIFISCRVSDWEGSKDRYLIERLIPAWEQPETPESDEAANPLLDPVFKEEKQPKARHSAQPERKPDELLVVQLTPLVPEQYRRLATAFGVNDVDAFVTAINQNGLDAFTERPGDLIDLINYWKSFSRFATFGEMVDHSINRKLQETDVYRGDNALLSLDRARQGAERLAAALTFGKSFTLRAPGCIHDPTLASDAIDPAVILEKWTDAKRNALLRRGIFAPSTYGRIRFHHRLTQEYLTAQWLDRILSASCPRTEVWNLFFASRYGVKTVRPSLRPSATWFILKRNHDFMDEIIQREPLVLLQYGDPGSLPIEVRKSLLKVYAAKHAAAEIANDSIDHRSLWMFADPRLADEIREAWNINSHPNFRLDLLRLIREGAISACVDLAQGVALDEAAEGYCRIVAIEALDACKDSKTLTLLTERISSTPSNLSARFASSFAEVLFPQYLNIEQLFTLIEASQFIQQGDSIGFGFPYRIKALYDACPDGRTRREFVTRLGELCLSRPFLGEYQRVSKRHSSWQDTLSQLPSRKCNCLEAMNLPITLFAC